MKCAVAPVMLVALLAFSACATQTGTESEHDSVAFTFFVQDEGELAFCLAAPAPNPYGESWGPVVLDFEDEKSQILVFKFYDPILRGPRRDSARLHIVVTLTQRPDHSRDNPLPVSGLWEDYFTPLDKGNAEEWGAIRFGAHGLKSHNGREWIEVELLSANTLGRERGILADPGIGYSTVLWGRYLFRVSLIYMAEPEDASSYLRERFWILEKVVSTLKVGDTISEHVQADCS